METQFLSRLCSIPLVSSTLTQLSTFYSQNKVNSNVVRLACETAEFGIRVAASTTKPLLYRFEPQIYRLNEIACHQLDQLEETYPIICAPTEQVVGEMKQAAFRVFALLSFDAGDTCDTDTDEPSTENVETVGPKVHQRVWCLSASFISSAMIPSPTRFLVSVTDRLLHRVEQLLVDCLRGSLSVVWCISAGDVVTDDTDHTFIHSSCDLVNFSLLAPTMSSRDEALLPEHRSCLSEFSVPALMYSTVDWIISHSPLVLLVTDYSGHDLVVVNSDEDEMVDEDGQLIEGVVHYVPVHPADVAALPTPRLRRNCWRRRP